MAVRIRTITNKIKIASQIATGRQLTQRAMRRAKAGKHPRIKHTIDGNFLKVKEKGRSNTGATIISTRWDKTGTIKKKEKYVPRYGTDWAKKITTKQYDEKGMLTRKKTEKYTQRGELKKKRETTINRKAR